MAFKPESKSRVKLLYTSLTSQALIGHKFVTKNSKYHFIVLSMYQRAVVSFDKNEIGMLTIGWHFVNINP